MGTLLVEVKKKIDWTDLYGSKDSDALDIIEIL